MFDPTETVPGYRPVPVERGVCRHGYPCGDCAFEEHGCDDAPCMSTDRTDHTSVYFVKLEGPEDGIPDLP